MAYQDERANSRARALRHAETVAEQRLWEALRDRRLAGLKFVRQLPVGPYVADFACRQHRLIVEVDGASHSTEEEQAHDLKRTRFLKQQGWRIIRCWNHDVYLNVAGVCDSILTELKLG